ncbi:MAG: DUF4198 domain-containing protein [Sphingobium sp.]
MIKAASLLSRMMGLCAITFYSTAAFSHDLTIYPRMQQNGVELTMYLGDPGDYQPIEQTQFIDLKLYEPSSPHPMEMEQITVANVGARVARSVAKMSVDAEGTYLISSHYDNRFATFDAKNRGYGTTKGWVRDSVDSAHFIKFAKSLFRIGRSDQGYARILNDRLEFIPLEDPFKVASGDTLPVKVLFDGAPLPDHKVEVGDDTNVSRGKNYETDANGVVRVPIDHDGYYRLAVDMRTQSNYPMLYDWDDYTASLVFHR